MTGPQRVGRVAPRMRLTADEDLLEAAFQRRVVDMAHDAGWGITSAAQKSLNAELERYGQSPAGLDGLVFHPRIMYRSEPGWPDLTMIRLRDRRLIFAELKRESGKLTPRQAEVLDLLCGLFEVGWPYPAHRERVFAHMDTFAGSSPLLRVGVYVWRPSDLREIGEILR